MRPILLALVLSGFLVTWIKDGGLTPYIPDTQPMVIKSQVLGTSTQLTIAASSTQASTTKTTTLATSTQNTKK